MLVPRPEGTTVPISDDFHTWRTVAKWESKSQLMEETSTLFDQRSLSLLTYTQQSLTLVIRGCRRFCRGIFYRFTLVRTTQFHICIFFTYLCVRARSLPIALHTHTQSAKSRYNHVIRYIGQSIVYAINWFVLTIDSLFYFNYVLSA